MRLEGLCQWVSHKGRSGSRGKNLTPEGEELKFAIHFKCSLSNNKAEYEAMLKAVQMMVAMNVKNVTVLTDSQLVAQQVLGNFEVKEDRMF